MIVFAFAVTAAVVVGDGASVLVLAVALPVDVAAAAAVAGVVAADAHAFGAHGFVAAGRMSNGTLGLIPCKARIQAMAASRSSGGFSSHLLRGHSRSKQIHGHCGCHN